MTLPDYYLQPWGLQVKKKKRPNRESINSPSNTLALSNGLYPRGQGGLKANRTLRWDLRPQAATTHYLLFSPLPQANRLLHPPTLPRQLLLSLRESLLSHVTLPPDHQIQTGVITVVRPASNTQNLQ